MNPTQPTETEPVSPPSRWGLAARTLALAVAYCLTARLSLLLALPPGYATAVWPPAGLALVAVLLDGPAALPGVWLGSFLANLWMSLDAASTSPLTDQATVAAGLGVTAALQAAVAVWLLRRFVQVPAALDSASQVARFLVLGGPIGCLVGSTLSVLWLKSWGLVAPEAVSFTWSTWWTGDTLGVLLGAPLLMVWVAEPKRVWRERKWPVAAPLAGALAAIVVVFVLASRWENSQLASSFQSRGEHLAGLLRGLLEAQLDVVRSTERMVAVGCPLSRESFSRFVGEAVARLEGVAAVEWAPLVDARELPRFLEEVARQGHSSFRITEKGPRGEPMPAGPRKSYVPVTMVEPLAGNESALGYDLASNSRRLEVLEKARDSGQPAASGRLRLVQEHSLHFGVLVVVPAFRAADVPATVPERRRQLVGYAVGVLKLEPLLRMVCKAPLSMGLAVTLEDCSAPEGERLLATGDSGVAEGLFGLAANAAWSDLPLQFAGRSWRLRVAPTQAFAAANRNLQSWAILAGGLCFCSLLGAVLLVITGQKSAVESLVLARTGQLSAANENLVEQIRERQRIEVALVEEEGRLRALMDGVVDGIATCAADGTIDAFNGAFAELFGCSPATLAGRPLSALLPRWQGVGQLEGEVARPAGPPERLETTGLRPDGSEFPVEVGARAFVARGRRQTAIIVRDISERHEVDRMKNEFISTVSHELRTPLTAIRGSLGLLDGGVAGKLSPAAVPLLGMSMRNVDRLLLLINDLLDADRIVSGRMTYNLRPIPVGELLLQSQAANAAYAAQYDVTLQVEDRAGGACVVADSDRLLQVLANLLSNAAKFSPRGGSVTLGARWEAPVVKLWVADRGPGIPEEFRTRIFSRFCQADSSDTRQKGGTGLGLNISRGLVEQMGGKLHFESRPGEGTTFTCELPGQAPAAKA